MSTCYLVCWISTKTMLVLGCAMYSEWPVSQIHGDRAQLLVTDVTAPTYHEAVENMKVAIGREPSLAWVRPLMVRQ